MSNVFFFLSILNLLCIVLAFTKFGRTPEMTTTRIAIAIVTISFCLGYMLVKVVS